MKLRNLLFAATALVAGGMITSCGSKAAEEVKAEPLSVDSVLTNADKLLGDTIEVEGLCSHLCAHGGTKAFLVGTDSMMVLRCQATAEMGGAFAPDCPGQTLIVKGVVCENRIDEETVAKMEAQYAAADSLAKAHEACDTEKKAQGQAELDSFEARIADYRAKIADRNEKEGKPYLSFYYLEALGYEKKAAE